MSYYFDYSIRKGIHLMNIYDYQGVISAMNRLENLLDETLGLFELADGLNEICDSVQSNAKGKVMGTRLQAYTFLGRTDPKNLEKARADSDLAIKEFTADSDKKRQYQYRCQIENEAENYKEALLWLGKSFDILGNTADMDKFLNDLAASIYDSNTSDFSFGAMHFTNIMAETALHGKNDLASSLYNAWTKAQLEKHPILLTEAKQHPFQIIYRNLGRTLIHLGSEKAALEKYDKAFENMHKLSDVMKAICEGEIDQYQTCYNLDITVNDYLKRIGRKTALLFSLSCRIGAEESKCAPEVVWNLWKFGKNLGMVFQIIDDLLDFSGDLQTMGKSPMTDFGNGVITLPIIYALKQPDFRDEIREIVDRREFTPAVLDHVRERVHQSGGLDYSKALADRYIRRAINNLKALPKIPARDSLKVLVKKLQERQY